MQQVYADNAATTKQKPSQVWDAVENYIKEIGTSPGRGGYSLGLEADRIVFSARKKIMELFKGDKESSVFFSLNITHALNIIFKGFLKKGDHVITTSMEHNAAARPLKFLEGTGFIELTIIECTKEGFLPVEELKESIKSNTKMITIVHASNVTGTINPIEEVGEISASKGIFYVVDCAQTAGILDIDIKKVQADVLAFTGHKGLMGPQGTGGCYLSDRAVEEVSSLLQGGTGSKSDLLVHPDFMPDKFESGTPNTLGLAGLNASLKWILNYGVENIRKHEIDLTRAFINGLKDIQKVIIYGPQDALKQTAAVSINVEGMDNGELSFMLDRKYGIMTRSGLHCAPLAHQTIGDFPEGTLRFSFGVFNTKEEVEYILNSLQELINCSPN